MDCPKPYFFLIDDSLAPNRVAAVVGGDDVFVGVGVGRGGDDIVGDVVGSSVVALTTSEETASPSDADVAGEMCGGGGGRVVGDTATRTGTRRLVNTCEMSFVKISVSAAWPMFRRPSRVVNLEEQVAVAILSRARGDIRFKRFHTS